ncbi:MAG: type I restriction endonuclease, partial [Pseudonocardiaceae bacterium]
MTAEATGLSEEQWEELALEVLAELAWRPMRGSSIAPGTGERQTWDELVIPSRLLGAMQVLNPAVPVQYLQQALAEITSPKSNDAIAENHRLHDYLVDGFRGITYIDAEGNESTPTIRLISIDPDANDWLAANQVTVIQGDYRRRFDIVLYCNGLPVSIVELKRAGSAQADVAAAHAQLQTYLREFPMAFRFAVCVVATDGIIAKYGTPFTPLNHFSPWNVDDDGEPVAIGEVNEDSPSALEIMLFGLFNQERFLQLQRSFTAFDENAEGLVKRIAKPHQYFAVTKAVGTTVNAVESNGKAGVVWHTQGSGKSMEMELYTNLVIRQPKLLNP